MALISVNVMVPEDLVAAIDQVAQANRVNRSVVVRSLILRALQPAAPTHRPADDDAILALPVVSGSPR